ncbi:MAG: hypothetical protein AMK73_01750 [Planctomycetes bacterium SM23_32]|nr:MAG: hypothetical protein AMK73_01750 [Planctomycetes bacterium SM23_32]
MRAERLPLRQHDVAPRGELHPLGVQPAVELLLPLRGLLPPMRAYSTVASLTRESATVARSRLQRAPLGRWRRRRALIAGVQCVTM